MVSEMVPFLFDNQSISHDFINSLSSVRSLSELLVENPGLDDNDRMRFLNIIHEETERLMRLLVDLRPSLEVPESL
ncbi:HisKA domain protein [Desulfosarcina variabilis str. Montpellier]|uniref:histidine kinase dimerization/phospho-acceptor domain-containing protein n=1 Tax=Desulfosarcina variabilis TaxID=2300 RepID=UPI003AFB3E5D